MQGQEPNSHAGWTGTSDPGATTTEPAGQSPDLTTDEDDRLLDLLEIWEARYRGGEDPTPDSLYGAGHSLIEPLRALIGRQKRLYARLDLVKTPADGAGRVDPPPPSCPGHEILAEIGRGGMGVVYKARDADLGRIVAIKTIAEGQHATRAQRERFRSEAQAVARLRHPNIIAIHAVGEHEDRPYLSLEFAEGGSLGQRLAEKPMAPREAAELLETLARAVHAAHQAGVLHRDLKPSNVLLTAEGVPKISDFGLAKMVDAESERTASGQVMGSPSYMSPEQAEGRSKHVGPAADIYALGAILYQALTGRPPFLGESALETLKLVTSSDAVSPRKFRPDVPPDLETICLKCLEKDPSKRYPTALALADDLRRFLDGRAIVARPASAAERCVRWCRRNPRLAAVSSLLVATVLVAAAAFAVMVYRHNRELRADYLDSRTTIRAMIKRAEDRRFDGVPKLLELRGDLLEEATSFYDRILARTGATDPVIRADAANAWSEAALVQYQRGHTTEAETMVRRALQAIRELRSGREDNVEHLGVEAQCLNRLGAYLLVLGKPKDAVAESAEAVRVADVMAEIARLDLSGQELRALCHHNHANVLLELKRTSEAAGHYKKALEIRERMDPRKLPGLMQRISQSYLNLGIVRKVEGDLAGAEAEFRRAADKLHTEAPDVRLPGETIDIDLGVVHANWSALLIESGKYQEAIDNLDPVIERIDAYRDLESTDAGARRTSLALHGNRAIALSALGRYADSLQEWEEVYKLSDQPAPVKIRAGLGLELARNRQLDRALPLADGVKQTEGVAGDDCYTLSCLYSISAKIVRDDPSITEEQRNELVESHTGNAKRWLKAAIQSGYSLDPLERDRVKADADLEILRGLPEFRMLIEPSDRKP
jgi:tetratricopeptide (TPR) repeat protein/tRNA A-37 threonylcarbamoyl transferase component Bud32